MLACQHKAYKMLTFIQRTTCFHPSLSYAYAVLSHTGSSLYWTLHTPCLQSQLYIGLQKFAWVKPLFCERLQFNEDQSGQDNLQHRNCARLQFIFLKKMLTKRFFF